MRKRKSSTVLWARDAGEGPGVLTYIAGKLFCKVFLIPGKM